MLEVDIINERVGPFRIGQQFPLPTPLVDDAGGEVRDGDAIYVEPVEDATIVISVHERAGALLGEVEEAIVHDTSGAILDGQPMAEVSLRELIPKLAAAGITETLRVETLLHLTRVSLHVLGDQIEVVWLGGDTEAAKRRWKRVTRPQLVSAIMCAAERSGGTGSSGLPGNA